MHRDALISIVYSSAIVDASDSGYIYYLIVDASTIVDTASI